MKTYRITIVVIRGVTMTYKLKIIIKCIRFNLFMSIAEPALNIIRKIFNYCIGVCIIWIIVL